MMICPTQSSRRSILTRRSMASLIDSSRPLWTLTTYQCLLLGGGASAKASGTGGGGSSLAGGSLPAGGRLAGGGEPPPSGDCGSKFGDSSAMKLVPSGGAARRVLFTVVTTAH